jgi:Tol biopolymer transport system component
VSDLDLLVADALELRVPLRLERQPAWGDVLERAGASARRRPLPRRRRFALALAAVAVAAVVIGSAFAATGHNPFGDLTSWLGGSPGTPAPAAEQRGFAARNDASYATFPQATKLRLLERVSVDGKMFSLLGFKNRSSLCLRLVQADRPAELGANECVTLLELRFSPAPVLVASQAAFPFGRSQRGAAGIFGFADDTVTSIEIRRLHGPRQSVRPVSNVFVGLGDAAFGADGGLVDDNPIVQVRATTRDGRHVRVPFVAITAPPPQVPSYFGAQVNLAKLPGPARAPASAPRTGIAWLDKREPRGRAFKPPNRGGVDLGRVVFSRSVEPDPESPFRVGLTLLRGPAHALSGGLFRRRHVFLGLKPHRLTLCLTEVSPLVPHGLEGGDCGQRFASGGFFPAGVPVVVQVASAYTQGVENPQITRLYGVVADGIREIDLYLASGRVVPAALRDNVYTVAAPTAQLPGKLVAYDNRHRPVWVAVPPETNVPRLTACPAAATPPAPAAPKPYERLDLRTLTVNGRRIFGQTPRQVEAALGKPGFVQSGHDVGGRYTALFYGGSSSKGRPLHSALVVGFEWRRVRFRASALWYDGANVTDARLGRILRQQPLELQRGIAATYRATYRRAVGYGSNPGQYGCTAIFRSRAGRAELTFGVRPWLSNEPYLTIQDPAASGGAGSPPAGTIVFGLHDAGTPDRVLATRADGSGRRVLPLPRPVCVECIRLSPDGARVLTAARGAGARITTAVAHLDGSGYRVFRLPAGTLNLGPGAWSPDGGRIAFEGWDSSRPGRNGVYIGSALDGGGLRRVTVSPGREHDVPLVFSPDGSAILVARSRTAADSAPADLYVVRANGGGLRRLSPPGTAVHWDTLFGSEPASWSPDGKTIAFAAFDLTSADAGRTAVFTVSSTGAHLRRITPWREWTTSARFSPDGRWIAFDRLPGHDLYVMRPDGSGVRDVVSAASDGLGSCCAVWSPDGAHLLFQRGDAPAATLWTVNLDGSGLREVSASAGEYGIYAWGP